MSRLSDLDERVKHEDALSQCVRDVGCILRSLEEVREKLEKVWRVTSSEVVRLEVRAAQREVNRAAASMNIGQTRIGFAVGLTQKRIEALSAGDA